MARSHVCETVRAAFGLQELVVDGDGDLPFSCGTAMYYLSVTHGGRLVRVWSHAVSGIKIGKSVLEEVNDVNRRLQMARCYGTGGAVVVEGCLPVESLVPADLASLCREVGTTADRLGSMLAAVRGGRVALPHGPDSEYEPEE